MYNIIVQSTLGDYVVSLNGTIYEITGVSVNISFNEKTMNDEIQLLFEGVDARDPFGPFHLINGEMVVPASEAQVDKYLGINSETLEADNQFYYGFDNNYTENNDSAIINHNNMSDEQEEVESDEMTIDGILDRYLDYTNLIEIVGDSDGEYARKMEELRDDFRGLFSL